MERTIQRHCLTMEEFGVRMAPKVAGKRLSVFRMHKDDHVPWPEARMKRENESKPWLIKTGKGQASKRYKADRVGNVDENSDYFIFYKPKNSTDTSFEVCPVDEWYNVAADKRYRTLTAEEAEELYLKREKTYNQASLMKNKPEEGGSGGDSKSFKISEMDDWDGSNDEFSGSENGDGQDNEKKAKKKSVKKEQSDKDQVPEEGKEDSDEGDYEQREVDYMSETSSESDRSEKGGDRDEGDVKGIDEEQALRDLLDSEEEEEEEEDAEGSPEKKSKPTAMKSPPELKQDPDGNGSEDSSDNDDDDDDYDVDEEAMDSMFMKKSLPAGLVKQEARQKQEQTGANGGASQVSAPGQKSQPNSQQSSTASKRKLADSVPAGPAASTSTTMPPPKRPCPSDNPSSSLPNSLERTIEDLIKKYLRRKPTTLKNLLHDIKTKLKRMGRSDFELKGRIQSIADIIKRLEPDKKKLGEETYLFLKS